MLIPIALLLLAAETPKVEPPKPVAPKSVPLTDAAFKDLKMNMLQAEIFRRDMMDLQTQTEAIVAEQCKAAGFAKCGIDMKNKLVVKAEEAIDPKAKE